MAAPKLKPPPELADRYPPEVIEAVERFRAYMDAEEMSNVEAGRLLGYNDSVVGRILRLNYTGDARKVARAMAAALDRHRLISVAPKRPSFIETTVADRVQKVCETAHAERHMAAILGPTGVGKTFGARHYCDTTPGALYMVGGSTCTQYALVRQVARETRVEWANSAYDALHAVGDKLRGTGRLLVIDEIDEVERRALHAVRELWELADQSVGVVLLGTDAFLLKLRKMNSASINQFLGRIASVEYLQAAAEADIEAVSAGYKLADGAMPALVSAAHGQLRRAISILVNAQRSNGKQITAKSIRRAAQRLMPVMSDFPNGKD